MDRKEYAKEKREKEKHSLISPSTLSRVLNCPASVVMCKNIEGIESEYAKEGTLFHSEIQKILEHELPINSQLPVDMREYLQQTKDWFGEFTKYMAITYKWFELKLPMTYSNKDNGTIDLAFVIEYCIGYEHDLYIVDWKYGKGVSVEAYNNPQLISYAVAFLKYLKDEGYPMHTIQNVHTIIYQPRMETPERIATYTLKELSDKYKLIKAGVDFSYDILEKYSNKNSKIVTSNLHPSDDTCKFCPAKATCKARQKEELKLLSDIPSVFIDPMQATYEELVNIIKIYEPRINKFKSYIEDVKTFLIEKLKEGNRIKGISLESKQRIALIDNIQKIIKILQEEGVDVVDHTIKLRTITDLKKELAKKVVDKKKRDDIISRITYQKELEPKLVIDNGQELLDDLC